MALQTRHILFALVCAIGIGAIWIATSRRRGRPDEGDFIYRMVHRPASYTADMVGAVAISDDGRLAAKLTAHQQITLVDLVSRRSLRNFAFTGNSTTVALDPTGKYFLYPEACCSLTLENLVTGSKTRLDLPTKMSATASAVGRGGFSILVGTCGNGVYLWRTLDSSPEVIKAPGKCFSYVDNIFSCALSTADGLFAVGRSTMASPHKYVREGHYVVFPDRWDPPYEGPLGTAVFDFDTGRQVASVPNEQFSGVAFDDRGHFATGDQSFLGVDCWNVTDGTRAWEAEDHWNSYAAEFALAGKVVVSIDDGNDHGIVRVLKGETGKTLSEKSVGTRIFTAGHFAAKESNRFLVAKRDGSVDVYELSGEGLDIRKYWSF